MNMVVSQVLDSLGLTCYLRSKTQYLLRGVQGQKLFSFNSGHFNHTFIFRERTFQSYYTARNEKKENCSIRRTVKVFQSHKTPTYFTTNKLLIRQNFLLGRQFTIGYISKHVSFITFAVAMYVCRWSSVERVPIINFSQAQARGSAYPPRAQVRFTAAQGKINEK